MLVDTPMLPNHFHGGPCRCLMILEHFFVQWINAFKSCRYRGKLHDRNNKIGGNLSAGQNRCAMAKSKTKTVRFAVGSAAGPKSAIWNIVFNPNKPDDIYLSPGPLMGDRKVSIHASGIRGYAFNDDGKADDARKRAGFPKKTRGIESWRQPEREVVSGFVHELSICVPTVDLSESAEVTTNEHVIWVSPAGEAITLIVIYMPRVGTAVKCTPPPELAQCLPIGSGFIGYQHLDASSALQEAIDEARQMITIASIGIKNTKTWRAISAPTQINELEGPRVIYDLCPAIT